MSNYIPLFYTDVMIHVLIPILVELICIDKRGQCNETRSVTQHKQQGYISWWRHQMETFSALLALCAGNSPVIGEFPALWRSVTRVMIFPLIYAWINIWVNNREAGDLRRQSAHYDVTVVRRAPWHHDNWLGSHIHKRYLEKKYKHGIYIMKL